MSIIPINNDSSSLSNPRGTPTSDISGATFFFFFLVVIAALLAPSRLAAQTFDDVPPDYWAYAQIEIFAASGITAGCGAGNYCPEEPVTRAQMAVFLERGMHGSDYSPPAASGNVFLDVGAGDFAAAFIEQLYDDGITSGCGNNNYCPTLEVSRAQMAVFLLRAKHGAWYTPPAATGVFDDVDLSHWAAAWIEQLAAEGITAGCGAGNYCPEATVNRAQMAVFLVRVFSLGVPAAPSGLTANNSIFGILVNLGWTDNSNNETGFVIERSLSGNSGYVEIDTVGANVTSFADSSVAASTTYYYRVAAINGTGTSGYAGPVSVTTIAAADDAPILETSTPNSTGNITLTWTFDWGGGLASTANGYSLEESTSPNSNFIEIYSTVNGNDRESPKTYSFSKSQPGTNTYYYRVRARLSNVSWSDYSNVVSVTVTIDNSAVLRIVNSTKYDVIDLRLNGFQQIGYPNRIVPGASADFTFANGGNVTINAGVGFYNNDTTRNVWFTYAGSSFLTQGQTSSFTFFNPSLGDLLSGFSPSNDWQGQYWCYSCNPILGYARFNFRRNGSYTLYDNNVQIDTGTATLVSWPTYATIIRFKVCPGCAEIQLAYPFGIFHYRNGPPDWPVIEYVRQ